jgi:hypothetical protein
LSIIFRSDSSDDTGVLEGVSAGGFDEDDLGLHPVANVRNPARINLRIESSA